MIANLIIILAVGFLLIGFGFIITDGIMEYSSLADFHPTPNFFPLEI